MERWQKSHLTKNMHKLVETTRCNTTLLARLESLDVLSTADLASVKCEKNELDQSYLLYNIIQTRRNGYWSMALALAEAKQSASFDIFMEAFASHLISQFTDSSTTNLSTDPQTAHNITQNIMAHLTTNEYENLYNTGQLTVSGCFKMIKETIPKEISYYIPRTLSKRIVLNPRIFELNCPDLFVFKGIGHYELSRLLEPNEISFSRSQIENDIDCRYIHLEEDFDWEEIRETARVPAHLIKLEDDNSFILEDTTGGSAVLQRYLSRSGGSLDDSENGTIHEDNFFKEVDQGTTVGYCICDSPGMGKTLLLANLARQIILQYPQRIVAFFRLSELAQELQENSQQSPLDLILEYVSSQPLAKVILRELFTAKLLHLELFLDGFDEVLPSALELARKLLVDIVGSMPNTRIYVTSRLHLRQELEASLSVISYDIVPFTHQNKIDFLVTYWMEQKVSDKQEKLSIFANHCLKSFRQNCDPGERDITGIPLQCRLLAEVHSRWAKRYCQSDRENPQEESGIVRNSLPQLYEEYIKLGLEKWSATMDLPTNESFTNVSTASKITTVEVRTYHVGVALKTIFPEIAGKFDESLNTNFDAVQLKAFAAGLLEKRILKTGDETVEFVHRTFAEYLAAEFLASAFDKVSQNWTAPFKSKVVEFVFQNVLVVGSAPSHLFYIDDRPNIYFFPVVTYFFNFSLKPASLISDNQRPPLELMSQLQIFDKEKILSLLYACIRQNYVKIFSLVTLAISSTATPKHALDKNEEMDTCLTVVAAAAQFSTVAVLKKLLAFCNDYLVDDIKSEIKERGYSFQATSFVSSRDDFEMARYFLDEKLIDNDGSLFHDILNRSENNGLKLIERKLDFCKLLHSKNKNIVGAINVLGCNVHFKLLNWLIEAGMNIRLCKNRKTIVHYAAEYMSKKEFHQLCHFLIHKCRAVQLFQENDAEWISPLGYILLTRKYTEFQTVQMILDNLTNLTSSHDDDDDIEDSSQSNKLIPVAFATKNGQVLEYLLNGDKNNQPKRARLDGEAAGGNDSILNYLSLVDLNCNSIDDEGNTVLHVASKHYGADEYHKIMMSLQNRGQGAIFGAKNNQEETPLHVALRYFDLKKESIQLFKNSEVDFDSNCKNGCSPLHYAIRSSRSVSVLKTLLECGSGLYENKEKSLPREIVYQIAKYYSAKDYHKIVSLFLDMGHGEIFKIKDGKTKTLFFYAVEELEILAKTIDLLVSRINLDLNTTDNMGNSILKYAVEGRRSLEFLKYLVELGVNWGAVNGVGQNLVHLSCATGQLQYVKYFVELGCNVKQITESGETALHYVLYSSNDALEIVQLLLASGVDKEHLNKTGEAAYQRAIYHSMDKRIIDALQFN